MHKVKYNRHEYRQEYLMSNEWKKLRDTVMAAGPTCQSCNKAIATDAHHLVYRNLVDVKVSDLVPVCRACHNYIHQAIDDGFISQQEKDFEKIKAVTFGFYYNKSYPKFRDYLVERHGLGQWEKNLILNDARFLRNAQSRLKKSVKNWEEVKPTGRQILKIKRKFETICYTDVKKKWAQEPVRKENYLFPLVRFNREPQNLRRSSTEWVMRATVYFSIVSRFYGEDIAPNEKINGKILGRLKEEISKNGDFFLTT